MRWVDQVLVKDRIESKPRPVGSVQLAALRWIRSLSKIALRANHDRCAGNCISMMGGSGPCQRSH